MEVEALWLSSSLEEEELMLGSAGAHILFVNYRMNACVCAVLRCEKSDVSCVKVDTVRNGIVVDISSRGAAAS